MKKNNIIINTLMSQLPFSFVYKKREIELPLFTIDDNTLLANFYKELKPLIKSISINDINDCVLSEYYNETFGKYNINCETKNYCYDCIFLSNNLTLFRSSIVCSLISHMYIINKKSLIKNNG